MCCPTCTTVFRYSPIDRRPPRRRRRRTCSGRATMRRIRRVGAGSRTEATNAARLVIRASAGFGPRLRALFHRTNARHTGDFRDRNVGTSSNDDATVERLAVGAWSRPSGRSRADRSAGPLPCFQISNRQLLVIDHRPIHRPKRRPASEFLFCCPSLRIALR